MSAAETSAVDKETEVLGKEDNEALLETPRLIPTAKTSKRETFTEEGSSLDAVIAVRHLTAQWYSGLAKRETHTHTVFTSSPMTIETKFGPRSAYTKIIRDDSGKALAILAKSPGYCNTDTILYGFQPFVPGQRPANLLKRTEYSEKRPVYEWGRVANHSLATMVTGGGFGSSNYTLKMVDGTTQYRANMLVHPYIATFHQYQITEINPKESHEARVVGQIQQVEQRWDTWEVASEPEMDFGLMMALFAFLEETVTLDR